jgi:alkylation response protein AidB-like acyl-CoA dehydrogenase
MARAVQTVPSMSALLHAVAQPVALDPVEVAESLARELETTAVERDRGGGTPKRERDALRASGLLALVVPRELGGHGADWTTALRTVRVIAGADGSLAHVFGFQHLLLATVRLFGTAAQFDRLARATVERRLFWGNALNPLDTRTVLARRGDERVLRGEKSFCSGSHDADVLVVSAIDEASGKLVVAAIPADRAGVLPRDDWDAMGQRQTDSGTVVFDEVLIAEREILSEPGPLGSTWATLRPLIAQLTLTNVYLGIAAGALEAARAATRDRGRAWAASGVERAVDDPFVQQTLGDLYAEVQAAMYVTEAAATALDAVWARGDALTLPERGQAAVAIAAAKITTTRVGLEVTNRLFDAAGARATAGRLGLDRFWRNLRTHTLHDPVDYKRRDLGRWLLTDAWPTPSFYS